jgi:AhpD family alkylhydroperoxidase
MNSTLLAKGIRRSLAQIRYVSPVLPGTADGLVASVYEQAERDFGLVAAPLVLHSPAPALLAAAWAMLRETLLAIGSASRAEKEVAAAAVSAANACPYCVAVHSAAARGLARGLVPAEITAGHIESIADPGLREIAMWAYRSGRPDAGLPVPAGNFSEIAGVAVTFHYLNRMVTVFLPDSPLPPLTPKAMGGWVMDMLASAMVSASPAPGAAVGLLPEARLPAEFAWARGEPHVASALARAAEAVAVAGDRSVPPAVRALVLGRLGSWDGLPPGPSRAWADTAVAGLTVADRAAGRLALLTALAPYQAGSADVDDFRQSVAGPDEALIGLTSWASMAAARTIGSWLLPRGSLAGTAHPEIS